MCFAVCFKDCYCYSYQREGKHVFVFFFPRLSGRAEIELEDTVVVGTLSVVGRSGLAAPGVCVVCGFFFFFLRKVASLADF